MSATIERRVFDQKTPDGITSRPADAEDKRIRLAREIGFPLDRPSLPETYERARQALSECVRVDELASWYDKASALSTYARQANDDDLLIMSMRIRARALRQAGKLLSEVDGRGWAQMVKCGKEKPPTQREVAKAAGFSDYQRANALRLANLDDRVFDQAIESTRPPGLAKLALKGRTRTRETVPDAVPPGAQLIWPDHDAIRELRDAVHSYLIRNVPRQGARRLRKALGNLGPLDTTER